MKKTLFIISLLLALAFSSNAQSITGKTWYCYLGSSEGLKSSLAAEFKTDGTCQFMLIMTMPFGKEIVPEFKNLNVDISLSVQMIAKATYSMKSKDVIAYRYSKDDIIPLLNVEVNGLSGDAKKQAEDTVKKALYSMHDTFIDTFDEVVPEKGEFKINSLYEDAMELENEIDSYSFETIDG